ncbi:MAG: 5-formyltetrahydrofolate cyclo-ligase [Novosphingobium sp.]|nr:5-formyltetrahydrofolate cyclo-ligase [Novosphingobium sp.]
MMNQDHDETPQFASPPCMLHELSADFGGHPAEDIGKLTKSMLAWRKLERERLIGERLKLKEVQREAMDARIAERIEACIDGTQGLVISAYWPFRNEPDLKPLLKCFAREGARTALPVVVAKHQPLAFREWKSGDKLARGVWNIPYPAEGAEVVPDIVIAPVVGFDRHCFRLGYGGGFFDRTLAAQPKMPLRIGVGYGFQLLPAFDRHIHDIPMDMVVTPEAVYAPE